MKIYFVFIFLSIVIVCDAQDSIIRSNNSSFKIHTTFRTDSVPKKHFMRAAGTLLLTEAIPFTFNRYIKKEDFAKISFKSISNNIGLSKWKFDDDKFTTNQFAHPYHGNLYFNSFRSNGYNFWASSAAAFGGSLLWETAGENQAPSPNDLINTSFGGTILGEMTHRIANKLLHPQRQKTSKWVRELTAGLINPALGFTRGGSGQWAKNIPQDNTEDPAVITGSLDLGVRRIDDKYNNFLVKGKSQIFARASLHYLDSTASLTTPFREFLVRIELGNDDSAKMNNVSVYGAISSWDVGGNENTTHRLMLSANYDMYHNSVFYYGGQSVNLNWQSKYYLSHNTTVSGIAGVGPVLLAAVPDQYLHYGEFRRYDYASGLSVVINGDLNFRDKFFVSLIYRGNLVQTINGISHSHYILNAAVLNVGYMIYKKLSINTEFSEFLLHGRFRDYPDFVKKFPIGRLFLRYNLTK